MEGRLVENATFAYPPVIVICNSFTDLIFGNRAFRNSTLGGGFLPVIIYDELKELSGGTWP
jgi:hypothetical protein